MLGEVGRREDQQHPNELQILSSASTPLIKNQKTRLHPWSLLRLLLHRRCLAWFHILGLDPVCPVLPGSTFTFHSTLSCYYCLTNLIILPLLCHAFSPSLLSSVCPSNLLGLAQSLSSASLLTVQPFDFLNRLCSHPGTFSSLMPFSPQMHKHWNITQSHFSFLFPFFFISSCVMHAALMDMGRRFPLFKPVPWHRTVL